jgi:hypothetical protein
VIIFLYYVCCFQTSDAEIEPELLSVLICEKEPTEHKTFSSLELSQQLFQPNSKLYTYPDRTTRTNKLDLVVNVSDCSPVPLGLQGTVIGIKRANHPMDDIFKVLFAMPFFGGLPVPMGSHEPIHCIHSLSPWEFINLSHGDRQGMHLWHQVKYLGVWNICSIIVLLYFYLVLKQPTSRNVSQINNLIIHF